MARPVTEEIFLMGHESLQDELQRIGSSLDELLELSGSADLVLEVCPDLWIIRRIRNGQVGLIEDKTASPGIVDRDFQPLGTGLDKGIFMQEQDGAVLPVCRAGLGIETANLPFGRQDLVGRDMELRRQDGDLVGGKQFQPVLHDVPGQTVFRCFRFHL